MAEHHVFKHYVEDYRRAISRVTYEALPALQSPPFADVAHGGAGTAFALLRLSRFDGRAGTRRLAERWAAAASADRRRSALPANEAEAASFMFGRAGVHLVRAISAPQGKPASLRAFVRLARSTPPNNIELVGGSAGLLSGARLLLRLGPHPRLLAVADGIAENLRGRLRRHAALGPRPPDLVSFAHGWLGLYYALMTWEHHRGVTQEAWLTKALVTLSRTWRPSVVADMRMQASWCTGAAGVTLVWVTAYERTRARVFLGAARQTARCAYALQDRSRSHVCCGMGGVAYALLAMERIDPGRGWREKAREVGARALQTPLRSKWPNGLLWGHPGLVCLALDLLSDEPKGFPLIEG